MYAISQCIDSPTNDSNISKNLAIKSFNCGCLLQSESENESDCDHQPKINSVSQSFNSFIYPSDDEFCELTDNSQSLLKDIRIWVLKHQTTRECVNDLLTILRNHGHQLPKDSRTVLGTLNKVDTTEMNEGEYKYLGIKEGLETILRRSAYNCHEIKLLFNVDGLPIFKSSGYQLWPITSQFSVFQPFTVALYGGQKKPNPIEFLTNFAHELKELHNKTVILCDKSYYVSIFAIPCDSPARSLLKGIVQHCGYHACERCDEACVSVKGRIVYGTINSNLVLKRTDYGLRSGQYAQLDNENRSYQHIVTPLYEIQELDLVQQFPLDYMHLVCLGVMRRILLYLKGGYPRIFSGRLASADLIEISHRLSELKGKLPSDFARQPRELTEVNRWKATEFRTFLLYTGIVVLKDVLEPKRYKHFLSLALAIRMLCEEETILRCSYLNSARQLLNYFVTNAHEHYGDTFTVYNIHNLKHLTDDVEFFQSSLDVFACFQFENYLKTLKGMVRGKQNPLIEIIKRLHELKDTYSEKTIPITKFNGPTNSWFNTQDCICFVNNILPDGRLVCKMYKKSELDNFFEGFVFSKTL